MVSDISLPSLASMIFRETVLGPVQSSEIVFILPSQLTERFHAHYNCLAKLLKAECFVITGVSDELYRKEKGVQLSEVYLRCHWKTTWIQLMNCFQNQLLGTSWICNKTQHIMKLLKQMNFFCMVTTIIEF